MGATAASRPGGPGQRHHGRPNRRVRCPCRGCLPQTPVRDSPRLPGPPQRPGTSELAAPARRVRRPRPQAAEQLHQKSPLAPARQVLAPTARAAAMTDDFPSQRTARATTDRPGGTARVPGGTRGMQEHPRENRQEPTHLRKDGRRATGAATATPAKAPRRRATRATAAPGLRRGPRAGSGRPRRGPHLAGTWPPRPGSAEPAPRTSDPPPRHPAPPRRPPRTPPTRRATRTRNPCRNRRRPGPPKPPRPRPRPPPSPRRRAEAPLPKTGATSARAAPRQGRKKAPAATTPASPAELADEEADEHEADRGCRRRAGRRDFLDVMAETFMGPASRPCPPRPSACSAGAPRLATTALLFQAPEPDASRPRRRRAQSPARTRPRPSRPRPKSPSKTPPRSTSRPRRRPPTGRDRGDRPTVPRPPPLDPGRRHHRGTDRRGPRGPRGR